MDSIFRSALPRRALAGVALGAASAALVGCNDSKVATGQAERRRLARQPALSPPLTGGVAAMLSLPDRPADARAVLAGLAAAVVSRQQAGEPVMIGVARSALERAGLIDAAPRGLRVMPDFAGDVLDPGRTRPDLFVLAEDDSPRGADARLSAVLDDLDGAARLSWKTRIGRTPVGADKQKPLSKNPFGFVEGQSNPELDAAESVAILPDEPGVPAWARGGAFLALRVIRMAHEAWDHDSVQRQEDVIGRRRDGHWLNGAPPGAEPPFADDPHDATTPRESHVRLANPRTPDAPEVRLLRRSWQYASQPDPSDQPEEGLLFMAFTSDLDNFETVQRRLAGEPLSRYTLTVGGGYYFVPRTDPSWVAQLTDGTQAGR